MARKKKQAKPVEQVEATETNNNIEVETVQQETTPETIEDSPKIKAIKEFAQLWATLPHYNYVTDKQAREIHKLWQIVTGRTDYYNNCSACLIAHVKTLKKIAKNEGIEI